MSERAGHEFLIVGNAPANVPANIDGNAGQPLTRVLFGSLGIANEAQPRNPLGHQHGNAPTDRPAGAEDHRGHVLPAAVPTPLESHFNGFMTSDDSIRITRRNGYAQMLYAMTTAYDHRTVSSKSDETRTSRATQFDSLADFGQCVFLGQSEQVGGGARNEDEFTMGDGSRWRSNDGFFGDERHEHIAEGRIQFGDVTVGQIDQRGVEFAILTGFERMDHERQPRCSLRRLFLDDRSASIDRRDDAGRTVKNGANNGPGIFFREYFHRLRDRVERLFAFGAGGRERRFDAHDIGPIEGRGNTNPMDV